MSEYLFLLPLIGLFQQADQSQDAGDKCTKFVRINEGIFCQLFILLTQFTNSSSLSGRRAA
jgi:hypothetical protein